MDVNSLNPRYDVLYIYQGCFCWFLLLRRMFLSINFAFSSFSLNLPIMLVKAGSYTLYSDRSNNWRFWCSRKLWIRRFVVLSNLSFYYRGQGDTIYVYKSTWRPGTVAGNIWCWTDDTSRWCTSSPNVIASCS